MNEKFIIIGGILGCPDQLEESFEQTAKYPDLKSVFLGVYIDRGTNPERVINWIIKKDAILLKGNHEKMLREH